jgi:SBF-like CPA transporter family (DUF4137)
MMKTPGSFSFANHPLLPDDRALRQPAEERCSSRRSYAAKGFGMTTGTLMRDARQLCPVCWQYGNTNCQAYCLIACWRVQLLPRRLGLSCEDEIAIVFCGSKKSLVTGIPMACATLARRYAMD